MAKKKAELELDAQKYQSKMALAHQAESRGMYRTAVSHATEAWPYIDGMMQFAKRYEDQTFDSVGAIDLVLRYAPMLLNLELIDKLDALLVEARRIERDTDTDMGELVNAARQRTWDNHRLWTLLEAQGEARQDDLRELLGGDQTRWRSTCEGWERMGLVTRVKEGSSYRVSLSTRLNQVVSAKCSLCGEATEAPKAMLLESTNCPACRRSSLFVLMR